MKKIMFNDKYGLTRAVLDGKKTMTRRIINGDYEDMKAYHANGGWHFIADTKDGDSVEVKPAYEVGETIAIAQNYKDCIGQEYLDYVAEDEVCKLVMNGHIGCTNKMFVRADLMPHRIRIKNIKVERLQDISDEDCLMEGIIGQTYGMFTYVTYSQYVDMKPEERERFCTPRAAFAALINKVSGRGTWEQNPFVFAYEFELVK